MNLNDSQARKAENVKDAWDIALHFFAREIRLAFRIRDTLDFLVNSAGLLYAEGIVDRAIIFFFVTMTDKMYRKNYVGLYSLIQMDGVLSLRSMCSVYRALILFDHPSEKPSKFLIFVW